MFPDSACNAGTTVACWCDLAPRSEWACNYSCFWPDGGRENGKSYPFAADNPEKYWGKQGSLLTIKIAEVLPLLSEEGSRQSVLDDTSDKFWHIDLHNINKADEARARMQSCGEWREAGRVAFGTDSAQLTFRDCRWQLDSGRLRRWMLEFSRLPFVSQRIPLTGDPSRSTSVPCNDLI